MITHLYIAFFTYVSVGSTELDMSKKAKQLGALRAVTEKARSLALAAESEEELGFLQTVAEHTRKLLEKVLGVGPDLPAPHYAPAPEVKESEIDFYLPNKPLKGEQLTNILKRATQLVGVDPSWATNPFLHELIKQESGAIPSAKNRNSSAFGLFQMVSRTWESLVPLLKKVLPHMDESKLQHGSEDPLVQAIAGLKYIQMVYKTPERAQKFRQATLQKNPELAPDDHLKRKAEKWIAKDYKGY